MSDRSTLLRELTKDLPEGQRDSITRNRNLAVGYAWGFQDCKTMNVDLEKRLEIRNTHDAHEFASEYAICVAQYFCQKRGSYPNIEYAYKAWCDGLTDESKWV